MYRAIVILMISLVENFRQWEPLEPVLFSPNFESLGEAWIAVFTNLELSFLTFKSSESN